MPIEFACTCGKQFKVADEYAGKRSKCTACGKMVTVPTPSPARPVTVEETAEDAALRALTGGDEPAPVGPRMPGAYAGERPKAAQVATPAASPPPAQDDAGSAASRALAHQSALEKASRSRSRAKLRGKGKGKGETQSRKGGIGMRFTVSWIRIGIGGFIIAAGGVVLLLGMNSMLGVTGKRFEVIWPSLIMVAGVMVSATGFIHLYDKKDPADDDA